MICPKQLTKRQIEDACLNRGQCGKIVEELKN